LIVVRLHRRRRQTHHRGGLAAADLRARRAGHVGIPAGTAGGVEQHVACGHHPRAAAAGGRDV